MVPPGDPDALGLAISKLLADPELRQRMGRAGRERVQACFTVEQVVQGMVEIYQCAMNQPAGLVLSS